MTHVPAGFQGCHEDKDKSQNSRTARPLHAPLSVAMGAACSNTANATVATGAYDPTIKEASLRSYEEAPVPAEEVAYASRGLAPEAAPEQESLLQRVSSKISEIIAPLTELKCTTSFRAADAAAEEPACSDEQAEEPKA